VKKRLIISLAVCLVVAAAGLVLPCVVFDTPPIIGGAGRPTMQFYMRTSAGQALMLMQMFGAAGALSCGLALCLRKGLTPKSLWLSLAASAATAAGIDCLLMFAGCFVMSHPARHPVALPVSIIGGCIAAAALWLSLRWLLRELKSSPTKKSILPCTAVFTLNILPFVYFFSFCYELAKNLLK
jgi:hypothetical protein